MHTIPITASAVFSRIPKRARESHKGTYGQLLAVCGSSLYRGAAVLACGGALRSGAGIVCMASVEPVIAAVLHRHSECTLCPLPASSIHGGVDAEHAIPLLRRRLARASAMLIGCGMGNNEDTARIAKWTLGEADCPIVLDADALNALSNEPNALSALLGGAKKGAILTPHVGEMSRLCGLTVDRIKQSPDEIASRFAQEWGCTLVLKDALTHVASPEGRVYVNTTGNAGLARGGSGDVLAGILASLAAQGLSPIDAAICAVWLHGAAADDCAARLSMAGMLPSDLLSGLCNVFLANGR